MDALFGIYIGILLYAIIRCVVQGFYVVQQNERAVKTVFGRAQRLHGVTTLDIPDFAESLRDDEKSRYMFPQLEVIKPGGPYFKFPWEKIHKVSIATELIDIAFDPENQLVNDHNTALEAVTKDQLNIKLRGQLRYTVSERNLYAYLFGIISPISHVMGYFISILRERIANFEAPIKEGPQTSLNASLGTSINDLRKNLGQFNNYMETECKSSAARYGITLDAALITAIEPPDEVESALSAINTAHNHVSSEISLAQASADQKIVQSRTSVQIETLKAQAEVQMLEQVASQLNEIRKSGDRTLPAYVRNVRLALLAKAKRIFLETKHD
ncbi:MAG: SPFH domain-containing protein [bacterium]|nr:SPFH domain-containing protein [bacterium]